MCSDSHVSIESQDFQCSELLSGLGPVKCSLDNVEITFFRLCDLKSLTQRRGSSEYDSLNKETAKSHKKAAKKKQLGLGDISSNSDSKGSDQEEDSSDEEPKFEGFKVHIKTDHSKDTINHFFYFF